MHKSAEISVALMEVIRSYDDEPVQTLLDGLRDAVATTLFTERVVPHSFYEEVSRRIDTLRETINIPRNKPTIFES
jgi:hypothetical protein